MAQKDKVLSDREKHLAECRSRGGNNGCKRGNKVFDIYLPMKPYSPERVKPWEM